MADVVCTYQTKFNHESVTSGKIVCTAYSKSKLPKGQFWAHFPKCMPTNCPLRNPNLLQGAKLPEEPTVIIKIDDEDDASQGGTY